MTYLRPFFEAVAVIGLLLTDASAANQTSFIFNGSILPITSSNPSRAEFKSIDNPDFVETVVVRTAAIDGHFSSVVRDLVKQARSDSRGAKLKILERSGVDDIIVIYLADGPSQKIIFKAERLSLYTDSHIIAVSYMAEFDAGNIDDDDTKKIKGTAVDALAKLDLPSVSPYLESKP